MEPEVTYAEVRFPASLNQEAKKSTGIKEDPKTHSKKTPSLKIFTALVLVTCVLLLVASGALLLLYFQASARLPQAAQDMEQLQNNYTKALEYIGCKNRLSAGGCSQYFQETCPEDWVLSNSSCYVFSKQTASWDDSRSNCQSLQADLVVITDRLEQELIRRSKPHGIYWIGLTDKDEEKSWKWVNGFALQPETFWLPRQPDNYLNGEHCATVGIAQVPGSLNDWNDDSCDHLYNFICKKEAEDRKLDFI
ncbi:CD209 antigen-like protein E [Ambystoma mexicanum]|uniref:CD209 antigen-like protein E n=1 Tax=Ambystoma mexicanum TaxID=8296 RepID=UPI0037E90BB5